MAASKFNVKVFSDNVCPWCFVGKRNLEKAQELFRATKENDAATTTPVFGISWKPFFLNVESPETSEEPIKEYLEKKYGKEAASRMAAALDTAGQTNGINFNSDRRVHNTIRSHRLVQLADQQDKGDQMIEQLFHGYFEKGMNIADVGVLLEIAQKTGVECTEGYLRGKDGQEEVLQEYQKGVQEHSISGVPYYIISREGSKAKVTLSGAQPAEAFVEAFEALS